MQQLDYDYLAKLVVEAKSGDSDAFAELYTATYKKQYAFSYQYVKDPHLAQDILQEVYILVYKNLDTLKDPRLFVSWIHQINFRVCYDYRKKQAQQAQELANNADYEIELSGSVSRSAESEVTSKYGKIDLMSEVLSLSPPEAQTIILKYFNDMTLDEIAEAMDTSRSTVKRRLKTGKEQLQKILSTDEWRGVFDD